MFLVSESSQQLGAPSGRARNAMRTTTQLSSCPQWINAAADADQAGRRDDWRRNGRSAPLPEDLIKLIAERFRALSEPTRIKLLDRLREREATVLELTELIGTTQQNVSKHLGVLQRSGIVARRSRATSPTTGSSTRASSTSARRSAAACNSGSHRSPS